ncbi:MAG TPA: FtsX-like permease family protein [Lapillicoccus sp.]|nr:FtsX-like permease family protein [Lapillicoccus sp.]
MWAAIRYRRAQAAALALLSALLTACAVFAPLYERALEQSLLRDGLTRQSILDTSIVGESVQGGLAPPSPSTIRNVFSNELLPFYDSGSELWSGRVTYTGVAGRPSTIQLVGPQDTCRSLELTQGTCPSNPYEIAVSAAEAKVQGWQLGTQLRATEVLTAGFQTSAFTRPFTVTAFFRQLDDPGHWQGFSLEGRAGQVVSLGNTDTSLMDGWVTPPSTFATGWRASRVSVVWLLQNDRVTIDGLDAIPPAVQQMQQAGVGKVPVVVVRTSVSDLVAGVVEGQRQARTIVPLLVGQLAVLAVVVLGLVAAAAVEQRRPELALGRLRGLGPAGAGRMVMLELGVVVAAGVPLGFLLALLLGEVARRFWLAEGVPFELPTATFVAALLSLVVALLAVALVARPTLREPISTLLRRVPPRRAGWAVGVVDAVVVAVAAAGLVTLWSGNLSGPLALATPTLIALALGLILAHVLIPLADATARRFTARGRVVGGLTAVQVARRPAVRRIMAIITVATALTVFATDALVVGARNREDRARVEAGAEAVVTTAATDVTSLRRAVAAADPTGTIATPVVEVSQGNASAMTTLAVLPDQFSRIAELPRDPGAFPWSAISGGTATPEVLVTGRAFSLTVSDSTLVLDNQNVPASTTPSVQPTGVPLGLPGDGSASLIVYLAPVGQGSFTVNLGGLPLSGTGSVTLNHDVACSTGCRLVGFSVAPPLGFKGVMKGTFTVSAVTMDGSAPAALGGAAAWLPSGEPDAPADQQRPYAKTTDAGDPTRLGLAVQTRSDDVKVTARGSSAAIPALVTGPLPNDAPGPRFQAAGLDGISLDYRRAAQIPYAPGGATDQAIVNLDVLAAKATDIAALGRGQVWVADPEALPGVQAALTNAGLAVRSVELRADREQLFNSSASAWGLRLALVVGLLALLIAALVLVLVAVTSWRTRSRDYAALRMAGVGAPALRRVGLAEQWTVVVISVLVGAVSGLLGAQLAMPIIPFFTTPSAVLPIDTTPATAPVAVAVLAALVLLLAVGAVVGIRLVGRSSLSRVREQL